MCYPRLFLGDTFDSGRPTRLAGGTGWGLRLESRSWMPRPSQIKLPPHPEGCTPPWLISRTTASVGRAVERSLSCSEMRRSSGSSLKGKAK
jgi:hypothetical protein